MPAFEVIGTGADSGRKRSRVYSAENEEQAKLAAEKDGTLVDQITELPPAPATERQIEYATDLGLVIPEGISQAELSNLISGSVRIEDDSPSTPHDRELAKLYGVDVTERMGKQSVFSVIQHVLAQPGRERELVPWFVFCVYRDLVGPEDAPIKSPNDLLIQQVAERLEVEEKIVKSIRGYEGNNLVSFGESTAPDGYITYGGSNRTLAYKETVSLLRQELQLPTRQAASSPKPGANRSKPESASAGCFSVIVFALIVPAAFLLLMSQGVAAPQSGPDCSKLTPAQCRAEMRKWADEVKAEMRELSESRSLPHDWSAGCSQDKVTREWNCFATKFFGSGNSIRVQHHPNLGHCFSATRNDHPGSVAVIRIGDNEPINYRASLVCGEIALEIIEQLMQEVGGATRGVTWPNRMHEFEFDSTGFPAAFEALKDRVENPRP